jgi:hypothetical protein
MPDLKEAKINLLLTGQVLGEKFESALDSDRAARYVLSTGGVLGLMLVAYAVGRALL